MRIVVQRSKQASVIVDGQKVGEIDPGLVLLVGITHEDTEQDARYAADKIAGLRIFEDETGKMNLSVTDVSGQILSVSQFTLYGDARKGRRPTWQAAAPAAVSEPAYEAVCAELERLGAHVERGVFGADMRVESVNDGPVTLILDSRDRK